MKSPAPPLLLRSTGTLSAGDHVAVTTSHCVRQEGCRSRITANMPVVDPCPVIAFVAMRTAIDRRNAWLLPFVTACHWYPAVICQRHDLRGAPTTKRQKGSLPQLRKGPALEPLVRVAETAGRHFSPSSDGTVRTLGMKRARCPRTGSIRPGRGSLFGCAAYLGCNARTAV